MQFIYREIHVQQSKTHENVSCRHLVSQAKRAIRTKKKHLPYRKQFFRSPQNYSYLLLITAARIERACCARRLLREALAAPEMASRVQARD
jgi:hypothetical protein